MKRAKEKFFEHPRTYALCHYVIKNNQVKNTFVFVLHERRNVWIDLSKMLWRTCRFQNVLRCDSTLTFSKSISKKIFKQLYSISYFTRSFCLTSNFSWISAIIHWVLAMIHCPFSLGVARTKLMISFFPPTKSLKQHYKCSLELHWTYSPWVRSNINLGRKKYPKVSFVVVIVIK